LYAAASVEPPPPSATTAATAAEPVTGAAATTTTTALTTTVPPSDRDAATWVQTTADARTPYRVELDVRGLRLDVVRGGRVVRSVNVVLGAAPPTVGPHHLADLVLVGSHVPAARLARLARRPGLRMEADDLRWLRRLPSSTAVQVRAG